MDEFIYSYNYKGVTFYTPNKKFSWMRPRNIGKENRIKVKFTENNG